MPDMPPYSPNSLPTDPMLARFFLSPEEKASKEKGKQIMREFYRIQYSNDTSINFYRLRAQRWTELLLWFKGSQRMQEFLDYMDVSDANKAYVNIDTTQTRIAAQFIGTLVESMAKNKTYACVNAIDDGSVTEKEQRLYDALFRMHDVETINQVQQASGVQVEPTNAFVPDDELSAKVYFELEDRLPKEIRFEKLIEKLKDDISFDSVANRKTIFNLVALNFFCTKIECLAPGEYSVRVCVPTNMVYNFFMNDTGEAEIDMIGEFISVKVRDFREKYGKNEYRPNGMTEKQIFELAKQSTNKNIGVFNYMWNETWSLMPFNYNRPYDDCCIIILDAEIDCGEDVYYVEKTDSFGRKNYAQKKNIPYQQTKKDGTVIEQPKPEDTQVIKRKKNTWMRGVYAPYGNELLYWGAPDLIITPFTNVSRPLSSYTVVIPGNDGEYIPSLGERMMECLREYQLVKMKRKQLIALLKPSGIRIDVESARNVDLGNGDSMSWEEVVRIYNQTGNEIWSSKGLDPLTREAPPLSNTVRDESIEKIVGCTNVMAGIINEIRQLVGVPMYRDGSDVGDRTAAKLAEGQNESSYNVTDYVIIGDNKGWEDTFYKICLLHWNDVVKSEPESKDDMINTRFKVSVKTKSTEYEKQLLEADIQRYSQMPDAQGNPSLTIKDAIMLRNIDNYKLACLYLDSTFKKNRQHAIDESQRLQQQNQELQMQSAQQAQQQAQQLQEQKLQVDMQMKTAELTGKKELEIITGLFSVYSKFGSLPDELKPLAQAAIGNVMLPLVMENKQMQQGIAMQAQQEAAAQEQPEEQQEQGAQQNPQEEMQEQPQMQQ
jgi:hypothetical protein